MPTIQTGSGDVVEQPSTRRSEPTLSDLGPLAGAGERAFEAPPQPKPWQPTISPYAAEQYREHPDWHRVLWRVSEAAREGYANLSRECDELQAALDALADLPAEQRAAEQATDAAVRAALDAGKPAGSVKTVDWVARKATLEAAARVRLDRCRASRSAYAELVQAELPTARAALAASLEDKRTATLEALQAFAPVAREFLATISALDTIAAKVDPDDVSHVTTAEALRVRAAGRGALGSLVAMLTSDDPVVNGRRHVEPGPLRVPMHTRRAWADGSAADFARLAEVEALADKPPYSVTAYTRAEYAHHYFPTAG
jgi:hypothetical protein